MAEDHEIFPEAQPHTWKARRTTWVEKVTAAGALVAIISTLSALAGYAMDALPFAKASEVAAVKQDMVTVKGVLGTVIVGQKESQELQLMDRVQALTDRLGKMNQEAPDYVEFRQQRTEAQQRLDLVRSELRSARRTDAFRP